MAKCRVNVGVAVGVAFRDVELDGQRSALELTEQRRRVWLPRGAREANGQQAYRMGLAPRLERPVVTHAELWNWRTEDPDPSSAEAIPAPPTRSLFTVHCSPFT